MKITFPRHSSEEGKTREQLKADEVLVKGGKKGVAGAKSELLEVLLIFQYALIVLTNVLGTGIREGK